MHMHHISFHSSQIFHLSFLIYDFDITKIISFSFFFFVQHLHKHTHTYIYIYIYIGKFFNFKYIVSIFISEKNFACCLWFELKVI